MSKLFNKNLVTCLLASGLACASTSSLATGFDAANSTVIPVNTRIMPGTLFLSPDHRFSLNFQASDRNLVLYFGPKTALWDADTNKTGCVGTPDYACTPPVIQYVIFQSDGNLVAYDQFNEGWGISKTSGHPNSKLALQNDGNLVIYDPSNRVVWATDTCCH